MLAPQKNKAGQRVYRRRDVEIVFRIRELLYDEKFTIAGAKRKLEEEFGDPSASGEGPPRGPVTSRGRWRRRSAGGGQRACRCERFPEQRREGPAPRGVG